MSSETSTDSYSPGWKRPSEVIRIKRRKKKNQPNNKLTVPDGVLRTRNACDNSEEARMKAKRRNPFGCGSLSKKANVSEGNSVRTLSSDREEEDSMTTGGEVEGKLLAGLSQLDEEQKLQSLTSFPVPDVGPNRQPSLDDPQKGFPHTDQVSTESTAQVEEKKISEISTTTTTTMRGSCTLPEDLSLKLRVRFTSPHPFSWSSRVRTSEEAAGVCGFVRCQEKQRLDDSESWASSFQQCVMTWIHPNLPWLRLFPRIVSNRKVDSKGPSLTVNPNVPEALLSDWTNSFRSVFQLLKAQMCPYFYVCGHQFTVLFHRDQIGGAEATGALLTPTSRGLREALDNEGVIYKMPLAAKPSVAPELCKNSSSDVKKEEDSVETCPEKSESTADANDDEDEEDDDDITIDDSGASCWLESMGLDKSSFPELDPRKVKVQRTKMKSIDHFPESLVQVEGGDTQALFNFLINSKSLVSQSGALAGVPPTILAPVAFEGATLRALKVKQGSIRQSVAGKLTQVNSLEVSGPLLPLHMRQLCELFKHSQHGDFSATFSTHEATAPFNCLHTSEGDTTEQLNTPTTDFRSKDVKELVCESGFYKWTT